MKTMLCARIRVAVVVAAAVALLPGGAFAQVPEAAPERDVFRDYTAVDFRQVVAAQQEIDPKNVQEELLSAAVFHETNKIRAEQKLPALRFYEKVRAAAVKHAQAMAKHNTLSHGTPWTSENTTAPERLTAEGLQARFSAENIAFGFVLRYESGKPFYTREENGRTVYSYEPNGEPLKPHTYVSFAEAILTHWMNSPPHRKSIVSTEPEFLGVGCALSKDKSGFDKIYGVQDFFTPQD